jgi:hypothetical protein
MDRRAQDELLEVLDVLRQQVGPNGVIVPMGSMRYHPSAVVVSGFVYPLELTVRTFADPETGHADLSSPGVLVYDGVLSESAHLRELVPVLEHFRSSKARRSLAVLALDMDGLPLEALMSSHQRKVCTIAAVGCMGMEREEGRHYLGTIARLCGATMIGAASSNGRPWLDALGNAGRILADRHRIIILEPAHIDQTEIAVQSIGLLSVGGNDARDVLEGVEWIEGFLGH